MATSNARRSGLADPALRAKYRLIAFDPFSGHVNTNAEIAAGLSGFVELCYQDQAGRSAPSAAQVQGVTGFNLFTPAAVRLAIIGRAFDYRATLAGLSAADKARVRVIGCAGGLRALALPRPMNRIFARATH